MHELNELGKAEPEATLKAEFIRQRKHSQALTPAAGDDRCRRER